MSHTQNNISPLPPMRNSPQWMASKFTKLPERISTSSSVLETNLRPRFTLRNNDLSQEPFRVPLLRYICVGTIKSIVWKFLCDQRNASGPFTRPWCDLLPHIHPLMSHKYILRAHRCLQIISGMRTVASFREMTPFELVHYVTAND